MRRMRMMSWWVDDEWVCCKLKMENSLPRTPTLHSESREYNTMTVDAYLAWYIRSLHTLQASFVRMIEWLSPVVFVSSVTAIVYMFRTWLDSNPDMETPVSTNKTAPLKKEVFVPRRDWHWEPGPIQFAGDQPPQIPKIDLFLDDWIFLPKPPSNHWRRLCQFGVYVCMWNMEFVYSPAASMFSVMVNCVHFELEIVNSQMFADRFDSMDQCFSYNCRSYDESHNSTDTDQYTIDAAGTADKVVPAILLDFECQDCFIFSNFVNLGNLSRCCHCCPSRVHHLSV